MGVVNLTWQALEEPKNFLSVSSFNLYIYIYYIILYYIILYYRLWIIDYINVFQEYLIIF